MNKLLIVSLCVVLLAGIFVGVTLDNDLNEEDEEEKTYTKLTQSYYSSKYQISPTEQVEETGTRNIIGGLF